MSFAPIFGGFGSGGVGGGGGGFSLIGALDYGATASSSDDFNIDGVDEVLIVHHGLTHPGDVGVRLSDDGGTTFYATSGDYLRTSFDSTTGETDAAATMMRIAAGAETAISANRTMLTGLQATRPAHGWTLGNRARPADRGLAGHRTKDAIPGPFNHLRVICPSGNITAGKLFVYGR